MYLLADFWRISSQSKSNRVKSNWSQVSFVILKGKVQPQINECFCASGRVSEISSVYSLIRWSEMALGTYKHRFKKTTTPASLSRNHETGTWGNPQMLLWAVSCGGTIFSPCQTSADSHLKRIRCFVTAWDVNTDGFLLGWAVTSAGFS